MSLERCRFAVCKETKTDEYLAKVTRMQQGWIKEKKSKLISLRFALLRLHSLLCEQAKKKGFVYMYTHMEGCVKTGQCDKTLTGLIEPLTQSLAKRPCDCECRCRQWSHIGLVP